MSFFEKIKNCNAEQFCVASKPFKAAEKDIRMYVCSNCSHIQTPYILDDDFYDTCESNQGTAQYSGNLDMFEEKIKKIGGEYIFKEDLENKIFEIGSGTGNLLKTARKYFNKCVGVDPSSIECKIAEAQQVSGVEIYNTYFDENINIGENYTAFMSFQVFEHLEDPCKALKAAYDRLIPGGVGLINVPNGLRIIEDALYHQVVVQHINYFTAFSLAKMAHSVGFEVLEINNIESTIEYDLYIKKKTIKYPAFNEVKECHKNDINYYLKKYKHICIWGAGAKSSKYIQLLENTDDIEYIVDSSFDKNGLFMSGINKKIEFPKKKIFDTCDAVIIFASSYNNEIIRDLRVKYDYQKPIILFNNNCLEIDEIDENIEKNL